MTDIVFRGLTATDSRAYREIRLESLKAHPESFGSTYEDQSRLPKLMFERALEEEARDRFVIGAFVNGELIGIFGFIAETPYQLENSGIAIQMYVKAEYRGRKIGLGLAKATIHEAFQFPNIDQIILGVVVGNDHARRVYEQAGFLKYNIDEASSMAGDGHEQLMFIRRE